MNYKNKVLLDKAKNKLLFLAFCIEYSKFITSLNNNKTSFISFLPIQFDGTCNGYQHLALLTGDADMSQILNLGETNSEGKPKDFYSFIALKLTEYFHIIYNEIISQEDHPEMKNKDSFKRLKDLPLSRTLVKLPIMVKPYNSTTYQMAKYIKEDFNIISSGDDVNMIVSDISSEEISKT